MFIQLINFYFQYKPVMQFYRFFFVVVVNNAALNLFPIGKIGPICSSLLLVHWYPQWLLSPPTNRSLLHHLSLRSSPESFINLSFHLGRNQGDLKSGGVGGIDHIPDGSATPRIPRKVRSSADAILFLSFSGIGCVLINSLCHRASLLKIVCQLQKRFRRVCALWMWGQGERREVSSERERERKRHTMLINRRFWSAESERRCCPPGAVCPLPSSSSSSPPLLCSRQVRSFSPFYKFYTCFISKHLQAEHILQMPNFFSMYFK